MILHFLHVYCIHFMIFLKSSTNILIAQKVPPPKKKKKKTYLPLFLPSSRARPRWGSLPPHHRARCQCDRWGRCLGCCARGFLWEEGPNDYSLSGLEDCFTCKPPCSLGCFRNLTTLGTSVLMFVVFDGKAVTKKVKTRS